MTRCISKEQWQWTLHLATVKDVKGNLVTKAFLLQLGGGGSSAAGKRMGGFSPKKLCDIMDGWMEKINIFD